MDGAVVCEFVCFVDRVVVCGWGSIHMVEGSVTKLAYPTCS